MVTSYMTLVEHLKYINKDKDVLSCLPFYGLFIFLTYLLGH